MTAVKHHAKIGPVPNQPDPHRPLYGFKYARKDVVVRLIERWGGKGAGIDLTAVGTFALDEFLRVHGDSPNPPPGLLPREEETGSHE
jgi:hypothetical protein